MDLDVVLKDSRGNDVEKLVKLDTNKMSGEDAKVLEAYINALSPKIDPNTRDLLVQFSVGFFKTVTEKAFYTRRDALLDAADGFKKCSANSELMHLMDLLRIVNDPDKSVLDLSKKPFKDLVVKVISENDVLHPVMKGRLLESITTDI